jgi:hypothetical protein
MTLVSELPAGDTHDVIRHSGQVVAVVASATRRISVVAVKVFVTEPTRNNVSWSRGSGLSMLVTP